MALVTVPGTHTVTETESSIFGGSISSTLQMQSVWLDFTALPENAAVTVDVYVAIPGDEDNLLRRYFSKNYTQRSLAREPMMFVPFIPCDLFDVRVYLDDSISTDSFQLRFARVYQQQ